MPEVFRVLALNDLVFFLLWIIISILMAVLLTGIRPADDGKNWFDRWLAEWLDYLWRAGLFWVLTVQALSVIAPSVVKANGIPLITDDAAIRAYSLVIALGLTGIYQHRERVRMLATSKEAQGRHRELLTAITRRSDDEAGLRMFAAIQAQQASLAACVGEVRTAVAALPRSQPSFLHRLLCRL